MSNKQFIQVTKVNPTTTIRDSLELLDHLYKPNLKASTYFIINKTLNFLIFFCCQHSIKN